MGVRRDRSHRDLPAKSRAVLAAGSRITVTVDLLTQAVFQCLSPSELDTRTPEMTTDATPVVLVADDEPSMLALVGQHIKTMGYEVLEASDGEQAWALAQEHLPDLVILDVMMPGMSGWEVCRKIREDVALAHTAIIMLTGIGENLNELTSPLYGADSYIDKPFAFPELDEKVRGALTKRQASRPGLARTAPADGLELVRNGNGNGNGGHHDHPH